MFVNRRELHPIDVQRLLPLIPVRPGHYWWDAGGNVGLEGGPPLFNINQLRDRKAQQEAASGTIHRRDLLRGGEHHRDARLRGRQRAAAFERPRQQLLVLRRLLSRSRLVHSVSA